MPPARSATAASRRASTAAPRRQPRTTTRPPRTTPRRPQRVALRPPRLRVRWERVGRFGLLIVLAIVVGLYVEHTLSYFATRTQAQRQQTLVSTLIRQNAALEREQKALSQPSTIVQDARALGMVRPGEQPYAITGQSNG
jgi:cell division protein FtsB